MLKTASTLASALAVVLTLCGFAHAQPSSSKKPGFEFVMPTGTMVPTGAHGEEVKRGTLTAIQFSHGLRPDLVVTGTVGWSRTRPLGLGADAKLDMFTYDAGIECRVPRRSSDKRINFKPFSGIGFGAHSYSYRNVDVATAHNLAAYASIGGEIALVKVRVRLEVRDYMTWLDSPRAAGGTRRNDVAFLAGIRLGVR